MISKELVERVRSFAYGEEEKYHTPSKFQVDFAYENGQRLAEALHADKDIVAVGMLLMDALLGKAMAEGRAKEHVQMAEEKTKELLAEFSEVSEEEGENILHCVSEHHGVEKFFSLESEICCNADCYKFLSVEGVEGGMKNQREMPKGEMIDLYLAKAEEKRGALSLDVCKEELEPQYAKIKETLLEMKKENHG